ncbi:ATP-dependent protease ATPase subunit HslU [Treponema brennaborense]|uniref:ATP-dependent protease ATPase subunit HslU n=1 Tax=Treponema brennaborense (strain DSM 12168 / CIP 105900 / DD5/3) TaxID=906968 RepID=F4LJK1_TREBD|nr:ATP-dependent protease ATPase subunit HslU [Treponema brennaborense]AEE16396.1 ATP-dependent hsl protease ATP-binding subunit hslU [Treponema brennaborense DSM 12168]
MEQLENAGVPVRDLTPKQIVAQLDTYIIGQQNAKKSVAIALRNRSRRLKLPEDIREEIAPKNILMIGPTGVGKTEIARRLAKLCNAPFLKVEATKYTEVGYVGRDVESMVRDLMAVGYNMVKAEAQESLKSQAESRVEEELLDLLLPGSRKEEKKSVQALPLSIFGTSVSESGDVSAASASDGSSSAAASDTLNSSTREKFRAMLREGKLEDRQVEVSVKKQNNVPSMEIFAGGNMEDLEAGMRQITSMFSGGKTRKKTVTVREARRILIEEQLDRLIDPDKIADEAKNRVEQMGIIFIDEIDKIAVRGEHGGQDVSREGVQRDILPIVEGSTVNTKYGVVDTTHVLFIAAGAFNLSSPSDLIPELQGRFPLRVELDSLHAEDFKRILTEPKNALTRQYAELLATENVTVRFDESAIDRMSFLAADVNSRAENIGARRLHTIMETLLEDLSFEADEHAGEVITITSDYVDERLKNIVENQDLSKYIL